MLMKTTRFGGIISAAVLAAFLGASALPAAAATLVKEVEVEADLSAMKNAKAATYWTRIEDDLTNAIVARLTDQFSPDRGVKVKVEVDGVALANSYESAMGIDQSALSGRVMITSETDNTKFQTYDLTVTFDRTYLPEGVDAATITRDSPEYYAAMVNLFAANVASKLQ